jgi:hypothetical protein
MVAGALSSSRRPWLRRDLSSASVQPVVGLSGEIGDLLAKSFWGFGLLTGQRAPVRCQFKAVVHGSIFR